MKLQEECTISNNHTISFFLIMKYYGITTYPLTDEGVRVLEKIKKTVTNYHDLFKAPSFTIEFQRDPEDDRWSVAEWCSHEGYAGGIVNAQTIDYDSNLGMEYDHYNTEWVDFFFGWYLTDRVNEKDTARDDTEYMHITFDSQENVVLAELTFTGMYTEMETDFCGSEWYSLGDRLPKTIISKLNKANGTEFPNEIFYSGSGDDGGLENGYSFGNGTIGIDWLKLTPNQVKKITSINSRIPGFDDATEWFDFVEGNLSGITNYNDKGCEGTVTAMFEFKEVTDKEVKSRTLNNIDFKEKGYYIKIQYDTNVNFGSDEQESTSMKLTDFIKTKPAREKIMLINSKGRSG